MTTAARAVSPRLFSIAYTVKWSSFVLILIKAFLPVSKAVDTWNLMAQGGLLLRSALVIRFSGKPVRKNISDNCNEQQKNYIRQNAEQRHVPIGILLSAKLKAFDIPNLLPALILRIKGQNKAD